MSKGGWKKSYGVTSTLDLNAPIKWFGIGLVALIGYFILKNGIDRFQQGGTGAVCPAGTHSEFRCDTLTGLPKIMCETGGWMTGGFLDCVPDSTVPGGSTGNCDPLGAMACLLKGHVWYDSGCNCVEPEPSECTLGTNKCEGGRVYDCVNKLEYHTGQMITTWVITPYGC